MQRVFEVPGLPRLSTPLPQDPRAEVHAVLCTLYDISSAHNTAFGCFVLKVKSDRRVTGMLLQLTRVCRYSWYADASNGLKQE